MTFLTVLYVPLLLIALHYLQVGMIGALMAGIGMVLVSYALYRGRTQEIWSVPLLITFIGILAYLFNHPLALKLYPLILSIAFLSYFTVAYARRSYPLIGWVERIKKRPLSVGERQDIIRSHSFWIGVMGLNTVIHLILVFGKNEKLWAAYAFIGWYFLFGVAISMQMIYVHRLFLMRVLRTLWGYGLFAGVIIVGFLPAIGAYFWMSMKKDPKPHVIFQKVASAMFRLFFLWAPGGGKIHLKQSPKVDSCCHYIYVATHESWLDYPLMGSFIGDLFHLTNKKDAFVWFLRPIARLLGVTDAIGHNALYSLLQCLRANSNVLIFPEGSRSIDGSLGDFKRGAFALSIEANIPIVPVLICGTRERVAKGSYLWSLDSADAIEVTMLEPMYAKEAEDPLAFSRRIWELMREKKERL